VRVVAAPEGGRATEEALALVADAAAVPRERVTLIAGRASRDKIVEVAGIDATEVDRRLVGATHKESR
jgi:uncharacterized protein YggU (UPF0235/DUF167 family)